MSVRERCPCEKKGRDQLWGSIRASACLIEVSIKRELTVITTESHGFDSCWENFCYLLSAFLASVTEKLNSQEFYCTVQSHLTEDCFYFFANFCYFLCITI